MRRVRIRFGLALCAVVLAMVARADARKRVPAVDECDVAAEALRDGLWNVARLHAAAGGGEKARLIELESFAREGQWRKVLASLERPGTPTNFLFSYWKALALYKDGSFAESAAAIKNLKTLDAALVPPLSRLRAVVAAECGDVKGALNELAAVKPPDEITRSLRASLRAKAGDVKGAREDWRVIVASSNAPAALFVSAAAGLGEIEVLRQARARATSQPMKRFAMLRLGLAEIATTNQFAEGEREIRAVVREDPDTPGAREAFCNLAEALLKRGEAAKSVAAFADAMAIWPEVARKASLQEGRGWAALKAGDRTLALESFRQAEALATEDEARARAAVKVADILAEQGNRAAALTQYREVLKRFPKCSFAGRVSAIVHLGELEDRANGSYRKLDFADARKAFEELIAVNPSDRERYAYCRALCLYGEGEDVAAEQIVRKLAGEAVRAEVRGAATQWLAKFHYNRSDWHESARLFVLFADLLPKDAEAPFSLVWAARAQLAENAFDAVLATVKRLAGQYPAVETAYAAGLLVQGEALLALARFDEAALVLEQVTRANGATEDDRLRARILWADALFAMGADNPARYTKALEAYTAIRRGETLSGSERLSVAFKIARTFEKLHRAAEAEDWYYSHVVLSFRRGRTAGEHFDDEASAVFAKAAFHLAEGYEASGRVNQALSVLELVATSGVPAAREAQRRADRLSKKGTFL